MTPAGPMQSDHPLEPGLAPGPPIPPPASGEAGPRLSVILVANDGYAPVRRTVRHLLEQEVRGAMEVVIVAESAASLAADPAELEGFCRHRVVEVGPIRSWARAAAAGVRAATGPAVVLVEDHAFPAPGWAGALMRAHRRGYGAVGSAIGNANPRTALSWANLLIAYGRWLEPGRSGVVEDVPAHNSAYGRSALLACGDRLEALLEREGALHAELRARGHVFYLEAEARAYHQNVSRPRPALSLRFNAGRLAAAARARHGGWSLARRLAHVAGAPLVPLRRLHSTLRHLRRAGRTGELLPRALLALVLLLGADGLGEAVGYALGPGDSAVRLNALEFDRTRALTSRDRSEAEA